MDFAGAAGRLADRNRRDREEALRREEREQQMKERREQHRKRHERETQLEARTGSLLRKWQQSQGGDEGTATRTRGSRAQPPGNQPAFRAVSMPRDEHAATAESAPALPWGANTSSRRRQGGGNVHTLASLPKDPASTCAGCSQGVVRGFVMALDLVWHPECFVCNSCSLPIGPQRYMFPQHGVAYHEHCFKDKYHPKCCVCSDFLPTEGRKYMGYKVAFWRDVYCASHRQDGTAFCDSCHRLCPRGTEWAELEAGRQLCLQCLDTAVTSTEDAQPICNDILHFFAGKGMPLPERPEAALVLRSELTAHIGRDPDGRVAGLCKYRAWREVRTVQRMERKSLRSNSFRAVEVQVQDGPIRHGVEGIMVAFGLPRLLTGAILAHESMHAFMQLSQFQQHSISTKVKEGLCQLMAMLWLEKEQVQGFGGDDFQESLCISFAEGIHHDPSETYGAGFRAANAAYHKHGLKRLLAHVKRTQAFPD